MNFRCHECGELFESPHTNYKHAKGFHPSDNPEHSAEVARGLDHCTTCQSLRDYDPVAARKADLARTVLGPSSMVVSELMAQVESLKAQVQAKQAQEATVAGLQTLVKELSAKLQPTPPVAPVGA